MKKQTPNVIEKAKKLMKKGDPAGISALIAKEKDPATLRRLRWYAEGATVNMLDGDVEP